MNFKSPRIFVILPLVVLAGTAAILAVSCDNGSISTSQSGGGLGAPPATLTPIEQCVKNGSVTVGGYSGADAKCNRVNAAPASAAAKFGEIIVKSGGVLTVPAGATNLLPLTVGDICLESGSQFSVGSPTTTTKFKIIFTGNKSDPGSSDKACQGGGSNHDQNFKKGIDVTPGATLALYGAKGVPALGGVSWTTLAAPTGINVPGAKVKSLGTKTLKLTDDVTKANKGADGWQPGDWIVVGTTSYSPFETEFVQIATVTSDGKNGGSTVTLMQPLKYYHFGSLAPSPASASCTDPLAATLPSAPSTQPAFLCDGADRNYGVDERAEVGLISRNIELTAGTEPVTTVPPPATSSVHWGGEIMIHPGFKQVVIQGVRLSKFGKDQLGSYPIHFHMVGDAANKPLIDADSVDHSYNHCVTIHSTSNLKISNLVCARIVGHIFYEELMSATENNPADDSGIVFDHDLGIGASSNSFDIYAGPDAYSTNRSRQEMIDKYWWIGDYMTNADCAGYKTCIGYDGFNIPDTDNWLQPVTGACASPPVTGFYVDFEMPNASSTTKACPPDPKFKKPTYTTYVEPPSGFWIENPGTTLTNNAIAGCQGVGVAYWWVAPGSQAVTVGGAKVTMSQYPFGKVEGDRASGCYWGYGDSSELHIFGNALLDPRVGGNTRNGSLIATLKDITVARIRDRGVWLRSDWYAITDGHFANNNRSVTLVTSGGIEGNVPGVWELIKNSVLVGESQNNIDRWGPCATNQSVNAGGTNNPGWHYGCIDYAYPRSGTAHSGEMKEQGYPEPTRNSFGYMIYDGPVRIFHDRFVNYNYNAEWTKDMPCSTSSTPSPGAFYRELDNADCAALKNFETIRQIPSHLGPPAPYEGDAALGWFDSNQNAYPVTTASKQLMWVNTNLRHQIYTDKVGLDQFNDGDKNTAIVDEDGTLSGLGVQKAPNTGTAALHPISLNNLPFNSTSNSVDECLSGGTQNQQYETRTGSPLKGSSLMSPVEMGQLEFADLYPYILSIDQQSDFSSPPGLHNTHWQNMTFTRTDTMSNGNNGTFHPAMTIEHARNGQGQYEPKVANGFGYYVTVAPSPPSNDPTNPHMAGFWHWLEIGVVDVEDPNITAKHPFYIRLGINYKSTTQNGATIQPPPPGTSYFTIQRGYKTYGNGSLAVNSPFDSGKTNNISKYWTDWSSTKTKCYTMDDLNYDNVPWKKNNLVAACPAYDTEHPLLRLKAVSSIDKLQTKNGDGTYTPVLDAYYYDPATGYLWLNIVQQNPNPAGPSPLGSCDPDVVGANIDPSCPDTAHGESYYACPTAGCIVYTIEVKNSSAYTYVPGPSTGQPKAADLVAPPPTAAQNKLVLYGTNTVVAPVLAMDKAGLPYYTASQNTAPACPVPQPPPS